VPILYFGYDFSGWYNFGKVIKIVAKRCHTVKPECTKFDFGWGSAGGPYSAPSDYLAGFQGTTTGKERVEREGRERKVSKGRGRKAEKERKKRGKWVKWRGEGRHSLARPLA